MSFPYSTLAAGTLAITAFFFVPAFAEQPVQTQAEVQPQVQAQAETEAQDPEEEIDEGLKKFGYLAGLVRGCVTTEQQTELEREALDLHSGIGRLLGTDRAFLFAAAFGYGTSVVVETKDCTEVLKQYEARVQSFRAGREAH